ncbi:hypothetical protein IWQ62_005613 [Dispira parvispora]|uniref:RNA polymerase II-associated protein 3 n=1 Tax=Dispira parvispora TaxID=1520584 RepID=A0A9W8E0V4_9FUNG|nr:hypothetical protein IWQ62_005613 [Dispira parvispora]
MDSVADLKAKGNVAFQKGNYPEAIAHYTQCVTLDPTNPIYVVNRAMAHLKLGQYSQAEADCTTGLELAPKNVKAWWRRGTSRKFLKKYREAEADWKQALVLEPTNKTVQGELRELQKYLQPTLSSQGTHVPVEVVRTEEEFHALVGHAFPKKQDKPSGTIDSSKTTRVEPNSDIHTTKTTTLRSIPSTREVPQKAPTTTLEFQRDWRRYRQKPALLARYLDLIRPQDFSRLFQSTFDANYLVDILKVLQLEYLPSQAYSKIYLILYHLSQVARFAMVLLFLDKKDQSVLQDLFNECLSAIGDSQSALCEQFTALKKVYQIS